MGHTILLNVYGDNVPGAGNQQERLSIDEIPIELGSFLAGFALGEASFMIVCRRRGDYGRRWKLSAAFNVSQKDRAPLELFRDTLGCGSMRKAGNGGWYWEVNDLRQISECVVPFFERFRLVGNKAQDFERFRDAVAILARGALTDADYVAVLTLRESMNGGGKRRYTMERILRDHTPSPAQA
jgi:LAGLIDADG DNA endonuclease family protein